MTRNLLKSFINRPGNIKTVIKMGGKELKVDSLSMVGKEITIEVSVPK